MTAPEPPPPESASQPKSFSVIVTIVLVIMGIVLLLPGLCSLGFMIASGGRGSSSSPLPLLWLLTFGIAFGGVMLIRYAIRNR